MDHAIPGRHKTGCTCGTDHDTDHRNHCRGCLPKPANVGLLCQWHYDRTRVDLEQIPEFTARVAAAADGKVARRTINGDATRRTTKVHQASPSEAWDSAEQAVQWAFTWAETIADYRHHRGPFTYTPAGIPARDMGASIAYLTAHVDFIVEREEFAAAFVREVRAERVGLELKAGQDVVIHRLRERCPSCNMKSLTREDGAGQVECQNLDCRRIWHEHEYANLAHVAAS